MYGSQYVTNQLRGSQYATLITNQRRLLVAKFFSSSHDEEHEVAWSQKLYGVQAQQLLQELEQTRFSVTLLHSREIFSCAIVCNLLRPLK